MLPLTESKTNSVTVKNGVSIGVRVIKRFLLVINITLLFFVLLTAAGVNVIPQSLYAPNNRKLSGEVTFKKTVLIF